MANNEKNFDQFFREKLKNHEEKPPHLAWERLDNQLSKRKAGGFPFLKIAASLLLLLGTAYVVWRFALTTEVPTKQTAEMIENLDLAEIETKKETVPDIEETVQLEVEQPKQENEQTPIEDSKPALKPIIHNNAEKPKELIAQVEEKVIRKDEALLDFPEVKLPELKISEAIALTDETYPAEEEVEYRIIIKSNGLKDEPKRQKIIEGIETKVVKIGGFLNKVEQGFADLQDAKDNLFASNAPRKKEVNNP